MIQINSDLGDGTKFAHREAAVAIAEANNASETGGWTYTVETCGPWFVVMCRDERGWFMGWL